MPDNWELHSLFKGLLDDTSSSGAEEDVIPKTTSDRRPTCKIGPNWEAESGRIPAKQDELQSKGADMVAKRDYQDMPPDARDATGTPKKKVKMTDLDKYEAIEGGDREPIDDDDAAHRSNVNNDGTMEPYDQASTMDIDPTEEAHHQGNQNGGESVNTNLRTDVDRCFVRPGPSDTNRSHPQTLGNGSGKIVRSESHINQLIPRERGTNSIVSKDIDVDKEGLESESSGRNNSASHKLDKATMPELNPESNITNQHDLDSQGDRDIVDLIEEAVQPKANESIHSNAQNLRRKIAPKPSAKHILPSQPQRDISSDVDDGSETCQQANISRPKYSLPVRKGYVLWWSNLLGKGQISELRTNQVRTIHWQQLKPYYGALHSGVSVEYQWEYGEFEKFWVVQGMPYIMYEEAIKDRKEYPYMDAERNGRR